MQVLVVSRNAKKLAELQRVLVAADIRGIELLSLADVAEFAESPETGATFAENAQIKTVDAVAATGLPAIADDSGIAVDRLNGMPGVLSARWSGQHGDDAANNALLLGQLQDVPDTERGAQFVSCCVLQLPPNIAEAAGLPEVTTVEGVWRGSVLRAEQGEHGFGYDPLFSPAETPGRSSAQLTPEEKDALSHRGKALAQLVEPLRALERLG